MKNSLINDINNYINYLNSNGLYVSIHGKVIGGLIENNLHKNPYCSFIKTNHEAQKRCVKCQQKVFNCHNNDYLFGMCYAGVEEYVFYVDSKTFISVSGYGIDFEKAKRRINRLSQEYFFDKKELLKVYDRGLKHTPENLNELKTKIMPLCHMISLLQLFVGNASVVDSKNKTFDSILSFVQRNVMEDITISSIADACACSESTVSHLFKEYANTSVKRYIINLRIKQAEKLLQTSDIPINNIALLCGFVNTNYFSTAFKKKNGVNPTEFRLKMNS